MNAYRIDFKYLEQRPGLITGYGTYVNAASLEAASERAQTLAALSLIPARVELVQLFSHGPIPGLAN